MLGVRWFNLGCGFVFFAWGFGCFGGGFVAFKNRVRLYCFLYASFLSMETWLIDIRLETFKMEPIYRLDFEILEGLVRCQIFWFKVHERIGWRENKRMGLKPCLSFSEVGSGMIECSTYCISQVFLRIGPSFDVYPGARCLNYRFSLIAYEHESYIFCFAPEAFPINVKPIKQKFQRSPWINFYRPS